MTLYQLSYARIFLTNPAAACLYAPTGESNREDDSILHCLPLRPTGNRTARTIPSCTACLYAPTGNRTARTIPSCTACVYAPTGNRTPVSTLKEWRPDR